MSEGRVLTPEQAAAVAARGHDVLLEAGAGTGKTGVIVDRYCRLVCDEELPLDAVLAFTFTDKAAAELRGRIRAELARRAAAGSGRAARLLAEIGGAWVTTIHAFCNRLLAGHPVAAGIEPRFRVLDGSEAQRAAREAFDEALEEFLAEADPAREEIVAALGVEGLRSIIVGAHAELRSRGSATPTLPEPPRGDVEAAIRRAREAAAALADVRLGDATRETVGRAAALDADGGIRLEEIAALRVASQARDLADYCEAIDTATARVAEAGEGGAAYRGLGALLELFSRRFTAAKRRRAGIDFEDLQLLAADLLERTELGAAYRTRFRHLLVDEFQDTNRLQLRLVQALRGPGSELLVVGDELQAIYGFRHADLEVFREQRALVDADPSARRLELSGNFRARPELIGAVNAIGGALLGETFRPLRVGAEPPLAGPGDGIQVEPPPGPGDGPRVELLLTARDGWDGEEIELDPAIDDRTPLNCVAEARFLAERLRALTDAGTPRGEIVVLLRAFSHLDAYEDSLQRAGLRPFVVGGRGYWSEQQVGDVRALLAAIANPLDDGALFGALASPACGAAPDTLWLLRAAAGAGRHVWPALRRAAGAGEPTVHDAGRLSAIPAEETALLRRFVEVLERLREQAGAGSLAALVEEAVTRTGYDLAVLMRRDGEARFANVRKLIALAAEFEAAEGPDLRGFLDFLAVRSESEGESRAATAGEGHDGVRVMTIHNAKGLEFGVVAVPDLSRGLLAGSRNGPLILGRGEPPAVGMQLRRLGAASVNLFEYGPLCEAAQRRDSEEELRLFHVAATRARDRLILSGVVRPEAATLRPGTSVVERIVEALAIDRAHDSAVPIPPPAPRSGLEASFAPSELAVRVNLPSPERAAELAAMAPDDAPARPLGEGPPPLVERRVAAVPSRPLSYSALTTFEACAYRFYVEHVLDLGGFSTAQAAAAPPGPAAAIAIAREEASARGAAVHALLEWSEANGWAEPPAAVLSSRAAAAGLDGEPAGAGEALLEPLRAWLRSPLFTGVVTATGARTSAEVPFLFAAPEGDGDPGSANGGDPLVIRGSIDLLVERPGEPPLIIDYKTDRLDGATPAERAERYATQRDIYALAVADARGAEEVEVAYVFLERPQDPVVQRLAAGELEAARSRLGDLVAAVRGDDFPPLAVERRDQSVCDRCPARPVLCSGPR